MTPSALEGLRVLELGHHVAGPYCTKLLADLGADVVKLERPGCGDPLRAWGPFPDGRRDPEASGLFRYLNANKRSVACDLKSPSGLATAKRLAATADLIVENFRPGTLERLGLGFEVLRELQPRIALVRISSFGQTGPYRDRESTDLVVQAAGGWVAHYEAPGGNPVRIGARLAETVAGSFAACAALTTVLAAQGRNGAAQVDVSIMECLVGTLSYPMLLLEAMKARPPARQQAVALYTPLGVERCADGFASINVLTDTHWSHVCQVIGAPEFANRRSEVAQSRDAYEGFYRVLRPWLDRHTAEEIVELCQKARVPAAAVATGRSLLEAKQFELRSFFVEDPGGGFVRPGFPWRLSATPARLHRASPRLGEANGAAAELWPSRETGGAPPLGPQSQAAAAGSLPFEGLRVLDLGTFWAGPYTGMYLASLGADVVKVESALRPDGFRFIAPAERESSDWYERGVLFQATNLGKRNLTLDLQQEAGRILLRRLIEGADVLIENFAPRVMERFGFDYAGVRTIRPDIIMLRMPGFGLEGPSRDHVGWALAIAQAAGIAWVTGEASDELPRRPGAFLDPAVAMHALVALQAALAHRRRTGEGQLIELAQVETAICMCAEPIIEGSLRKRVREREGNRSRTFAPQGVYPCLDGGWVALSIRDDAEWDRFVQALGQPEWAADSRLATREDRQKRSDDVDRRIAAWTSEREAAQIAGALGERGIPAAEVLIPSKMYGEPHLEARGYYQSLEHSASGARRYPAWPMRFSYARGDAHRAGTATLGQHNEEILRGELGLSLDEIERLRAEGVIGERWAPPPDPRRD
ncbi:MAG: CoA transferase [Proteobacteria bacterium]|nr:CoA transferase [Pseudomonadota bacterium]